MPSISPELMPMIPPCGEAVPTVPFAAALHVLPSSPTSTDMTLYVTLRSVAPSEQVIDPPKEGPYHPWLPYSI
jgi:hypothetical protein